MTPKTIALVDWHWVGHHPLYYKEFVRTLLRLGHHVVAFSPRPDDVQASVDAAGMEVQGRLQLERLELIHEPGGVLARLRRRFLGSREVREVRRRIERWQADTGRAIDLVFFACMYDPEFASFPHDRFAWPYDWSGLYLQVNYLRNRKSLEAGGYHRAIEKLLRHPRLKAIAVLDEGAATASWTAAPIVVFPDFTDASTAGPGDALAKRIRAFANGAPLIGLFGHLFPNKGVVTLAKVALDPRFQDLRFVFVGELPVDSYSRDERDLLRRLSSAPNVLTHFERVPDEASFNQGLLACDIVFAAYEGFPHSSNILTKAAFLERPVIVSEGGLMASRTKEYGLGLIVPEASTEATGQAIRSLIGGAAGPAGSVPPPRWPEFRARHNRETLESAFDALLRKACA